RAKISSTTGGRTWRSARVVCARGAHTRRDRCAIDFAFAGRRTRTAISADPRARPKRFLARAASDAGERRVRNARPGPQRFRVRQEISARDPPDRPRPLKDKVDDDAFGLCARKQGGNEVTTIADQETRRRFACELETNFSVIASAGSGKTRAITDRIVEIAKDRQRAAEWLPQLVVVTYTNRAADEMQARQLMELARNQDHEFSAIQPKERCPECDFSKVEAAIETAQAKNIPKTKAQLRDWIERWRTTDEFAPWPPCATTEKEFVRRW